MRPLAFLRRGSPGQSMVLGSVAMLAMALGVLATLNLGQAVHEKIKLQNTADSAAYSLATLEARTFNFIAFTNRLQVTHYHSAMAVQSYLSFAGFSLAYFGTAADLFRGVKMGVETGCNMPYPVNIPYCIVLPFATAISAILDAFGNAANQLYEVGHLLATQYIEAMSLYNRDAVWRRIQLLKAAQLNVHILTGMQDYIKTNDAQLGWTSHNNWLNMVVNMALNSYEYWSAFEQGSGINPSAIGLISGFTTDLWKYKQNASDKRVQEAQSIMAEIANATRSDANIYNRKQNFFPSIVALVIGSKMGQTRIIGKGTSSDPTAKPAVSEMRTEGHYWNGSGGGCIGDRLASDDYLSNATGFAFAGIEATIPPMAAQGLIGDGIVTAAQKADHYRYNFGSGWRGLQTHVPLPMPPKSSFTKNGVISHDSDRHKWTGSPYLSPYISFKADSAMTPDPSSPTKGPDLKAHDYNQPNTWIYLNKQPDLFQTASGNKMPWYQKFSYTAPGGMARGNFKRQGGNLVFTPAGAGTVTLDTEINGDRTALMGIMKGLNVLSRGQVYYHRPGDWREQPNMFNPFWRARLAPVAQVLTNLWERLVGNNLVPGPQAGALQQILQNFVNNALADFFFSAVTQLICH